ncbi:MAG: GNAT family N-acetyltransferase [Anaerolineae bacterium]
MDRELAEQLERHEELGNASSAWRIGGEVWERGDVVALYSHPQFGTGLNFACRVRSTEQGIDELLDDVIEWFSWRNVKPHVRVNPLSRPIDLAERLKRRGFTQTEMETQMVLTAKDIERPPNLRVTIELVRIPDLGSWLSIQNRGFGSNGQPTPLSIELNRATVNAGWRPYLARLDGEPVAAGMLSSFENTWGIYGVATLPDARGQGVGTALMRRMVADAQAEMASCPVCLQAETAGPAQRWYERLGFRVVYDRTGWSLEV